MTISKTAFNIMKLIMTLVMKLGITGQKNVWLSVSIYPTAPSVVASLLVIPIFANKLEAYPSGAPLKCPFSVLLLLFHANIRLG